MRNAADAYAASWPDENTAFRRGYYWDVPDRAPGNPPRRRLKGQTLDRLAAEIAADHRLAVSERV